jgi:uncharacterized membrane protein HdeD (DUF308 family)
VIQCGAVKQFARGKVVTHIGGFMIVLGLILLLIGFITGIAIVWSVGMIILIVGLVLWLLGAMGHAVGGRRHYY